MGVPPIYQHASASCQQLACLMLSDNLIYAVHFSRDINSFRVWFMNAGCRSICSLRSPSIRPSLRPNAFPTPLFWSFTRTVFLSNISRSCTPNYSKTVKPYCKSGSNFTSIVPVPTCCELSNGQTRLNILHHNIHVYGHCEHAGPVNIRM